MQDLASAVAEAKELRQRLHETPEVAFQEHETGRVLAAWLSARGVEVTAGVGGTGLLARVEGAGSGPARLFRADLDAIPLSAPGQPGVPGGAQHGCGHDGHSAMLAGALAMLAAAPDRWSGSVLGVFQPAEETGQGAQAMLGHEALASAAVDVAYAIHNQPGLPLGSVGIAAAVAAVASTGLSIRVTGRATHASTPHKGNAAIAMLSTLVGELLSLPSYVTPFGSSLLITPTFLDCGQRQFGRVPSEGELGFVLRSNDDALLEKVLVEGRQLVDGLARAYELEVVVDRVEPFPVTQNDPRVVTNALRDLAGAGLPVARRDAPQPWSEDFGYFLARWPGALLLLGAGEDHPTLHSRRYGFPDALLGPGLRVWTALAGWTGGA